MINQPYSGINPIYEENNYSQFWFNVSKLKDIYNFNFKTDLFQCENFKFIIHDQLYWNIQEKREKLKAQLNNKTFAKMSLFITENYISVSAEKCRKIFERALFSSNEQKEVYLIPLDDFLPGNKFNSKLREVFNSDFTNVLFEHLNSMKTIQLKFNAQILKELIVKKYNSFKK